MLHFSGSIKICETGKFWDCPIRQVKYDGKNKKHSQGIPLRKIQISS